MSDSLYAALLDTSAVVRFTHSVAVGELIAMVAEEHRRVGVPVLCAVQALRDFPKSEPSLVLLLALPVVDLLPVSVTNFHAMQRLTDFTRTVGAIDLGSVLHLAEELGLPHIYTADPQAYAQVDLDDGPELIAIED